MNLFEKVKSLLIDDGQPQIVISSRSDGLSVTGMPVFIAPWISNCTKTLRCSDGTNLPIRTTSSLITGVSAYKKEILIRQIANAICDGFTPVVLSSNGQYGEVFDVLRTIYAEFAINYISESINSGCYVPFGSIPSDYIVEFFYQMVMEFQQQPTNGMLVRNYINVCVRVFFSDGNSVCNLMNGQLNHMGLLQEIQQLYQNNMITEQRKREFEDAANSAQSVSVEVFSVIQDYLYKVRCVSVSRPVIQIHNAAMPHITILGANGQNIRPFQNVSERIAGGYDLSNILKGECIFLQVDNEIPGNFNNSIGEQCFQWYLSKTLQMEINAKPEVRNSRILLIIEDISPVILNWFWWLIDLPNCVLLLSYEDVYSKIADSQERRQQLISKMDRIYFFSVIDEQSAGWVSRTLGTHMVPKVVVTEQPYRDWTDFFIRPKSYAHDEVEKPWFSTHEIQHLGDDGIVYSRRDKVFTACYRENGRTYKDKNYRGKRVNFCTFRFR